MNEIYHIQPRIISSPKKSCIEKNCLHLHFLILSIPSSVHILLLLHHLHAETQRSNQLNGSINSERVENDTTISSDPSTRRDRLHRLHRLTFPFVLARNDICNRVKSLFLGRGWFHWIVRDSEAKEGRCFAMGGHNKQHAWFPFHSRAMYSGKRCNQANRRRQ